MAIRKPSRREGVRQPAAKKSPLQQKVKTEVKRRPSAGSESGSSSGRRGGQWRWLPAGVHSVRVGFTARIHVGHARMRAGRRRAAVHLHLLGQCQERLLLCRVGWGGGLCVRLCVCVCVCAFVYFLGGSCGGGGGGMQRFNRRHVRRVLRALARPRRRGTAEGRDVLI